MIVYVCSRYRADTKAKFEKQIMATKTMSREIAIQGHDIIAPHLYYPDFLNDNNQEDRKIGMESAIRLLKVCDALYVYIGLGVSEGMEAEIETAERLEIPIRYFRNNNELKDILKKQTQENRATNAKVPHSETQEFKEEHF